MTNTIQDFTVLTDESSNIDIESITTTVSDNIDKQLVPRNRAERRAFAKKAGKKGRQQFDLITETARKLNYIDLIQKMRQLNEEKEKEKNEAIENRDTNV